MRASVPFLQVVACDTKFKSRLHEIIFLLSTFRCSQEGGSMIPEFPCFRDHQNICEFDHKNLGAQFVLFLAKIVWYAFTIKAIS